MASIELITENGSKMYYPVVEEGLEWTTERKDTPGKLVFTVLDDGNLTIKTGNAVRFKYDGNKVFYGFVFKMETTKTNEIEVTAYDQLRYLMNKDTYVYTNKTATQVIKMIASDYSLKTGTLANTSYIISSRSEENKTLFDVIQNALDLTLDSTKNMYVLYDNFGKINLTKIDNMRTNLLLDEETSEDYEYTTSIDDDTYNQIKLTYDNDDTGKREIYMAKSSANINKWGVLQYFDTIDGGTNGKTKASSLLTLYNQETKKLTIKNVLGNVNARAGASVVVNLKLNDETISGYMIIDKAIHKFDESQYLMDLTLRNGAFNSD